MDKRVFWTTKSPLAEYHGITFNHPSFEAPIRLVANQYEEVTLGGEVFKPVSMTIKAPEQTSDSQPKMTLSFPRPVVGREFKRQLALITGSTTIDPITVEYSVYLGNVDTPSVTWSLYIGDQAGVAFTPDSVQVTASDDNPMRRSVAPIYDPAEFTGLELI
jgi:hypothetical protein